jgi:hypothetical protein
MKNSFKIDQFSPKIKIGINIILVHVKMEIWTVILIINASRCVHTNHGSKRFKIGIK